MKHLSRGSVVVITPEIKSGDLEFDSQPRPWIFHFLQWVRISVPEDLYICICIPQTQIKMQVNHPVVMSVKYIIQYISTRQASLHQQVQMKSSKYTGKVHTNITVTKFLNKGLLCIKFQVTLAKLLKKPIAEIVRECKVFSCGNRG